MIFITHSDNPSFWQTYLSDPASITMEGILIFNKHLLFLLTVIVLFVGWLLFYTIHYFIEYNNKFSSKFVHSKKLRIVWTFISALLLLILFTPSFTLLYAMNEILTNEPIWLDFFVTGFFMDPKDLKLYKEIQEIYQIRTDRLDSGIRYHLHVFVDTKRFQRRGINTGTIRALLVPTATGGIKASAYLAELEVSNFANAESLKQSNSLFHSGCNDTPVSTLRALPHEHCKVWEVHKMSLVDTSIGIQIKIKELPHLPQPQEG